MGKEDEGLAKHVLMFQGNRLEKLDSQINRENLETKKSQ